MRATAVVLAMLVSLGARAEECPWVEPKAPPKLEVDEGFAMVTWRLDSKWFACAKKAGGSATVEVLVGTAKGLAPFKTNDKVSASISEGIWRNAFCELRPVPDRVQVKITGNGPMSRLQWESPITTGLHCDRCEYRSYEGSMAVHVASGLTPKGMITIQGSYDGAFRRCALEDPGNKVELRVFLGRTEQEARLGTEPTFVIPAIEKSEKFKEPLSHAEVCRDKPAFIGVELFGTGEFARLNGSRSVVAAKCDKIR